MNNTPEFSPSEVISWSFSNRIWLWHSDFQGYRYQIISHSCKYSAQKKDQPVAFDLFLTEAVSVGTQETAQLNPWRLSSLSASLITSQLMAEIKSSIRFEIPIEGEEIFWIVKVILEVSSMINTYTAQSYCITMTRKKERIGSFIIYIKISFVHCSDFVLQNTEYSWL